MTWPSRFLAAGRPSINQMVEVSCNAEGIIQSIDDTSVHIPWQEITSVSAYKKDCFSTDQIRLIVEAGGLTFEFTEDDSGFRKLGEGIAEYLPNSLRGWHQRLVMSPAFETTWTEVYPLKAD